MKRGVAFQKKFGRAPGPGDPLLWDPDSDTPRPIPPEKVKEMFDRMIELFRKDGCPEALIHAARMSDRAPLSRAAFSQLGPDEQEAWEMLVEEGAEVHADGSECRCTKESSKVLSALFDTTFVNINNETGLFGPKEPA